MSSFSMGRSVVGRFKSEVKERIVRLEKEMSKGFGSTELPKYRAFSPTYTEREIATELYRKERLNSNGCLCVFCYAI